MGLGKHRLLSQRAWKTTLSGHPLPKQPWVVMLADHQPQGLQG